MDISFKPFAVKTGYVPKEDEYRNEEGILFCKTCHTPRQTTLSIGGRVLTVHALCRCKGEARDRQEAEQKAKLQREAIERNRSIGLTDETMALHTFDNDLGFNADVMKTARGYVENWEQSKKEGHGLVFWGEVGTGKSFIADCIGNELLNRGVRVLITNFPRLLNRLSDLSLGDKNGFIQDLNSYELLILDDFGTERRTDYAKEQIYSIIDSRYRSGLPMIITTNLHMKAFADDSDMSMQRIFDRIAGKNLFVSVREQNVRKALGEKAINQFDALLSSTPIPTETNSTPHDPQSPNDPHTPNDPQSPNHPHTTDNLRNPDNPHTP